MEKKALTGKIIVLVIALVLAVISGIEFWQLRHYKETIVASEDLTEVKWLSDYEPSLKDGYTRIHFRFGS